jgi:hypothetical protein
MLRFRLHFHRDWKFWRRSPRLDRTVAQLYSARLGRIAVEEGEHYKLVRFEKDGKFDYDLYRQIQILGNKSKLDWVSIQEENIAYLCRALEGRIPEIRFVLCHGTRNGAEQKFFQAHLTKPAIILGTEISDTATRFPMTIEWDFHEVKPEWRDAVDIVFSNSWDHTYDPHKLFPAWLSCLSQRGIMALEWTEKHAQTGESALDPFGAKLEGLLEVLSVHSAHGKFETEVLTDMPLQNSGRRVFVLVQRLR